MPYDSSGNASVTRNIAVTGQTVLAEQVNVPFADIQSMLSQVVLRSGVAPMTGPLNLNNYKATNLGDPSSPGDAVPLSYLQNLIGDPWAFQPIGSFIALDAGDGLKPPKSSLYSYIQLTAGLTGVGDYNEGLLTTETVTGTDPLISATAVVSLTGSPLNGKTIRLINTERRFLRAGVGGTLEDSQNLAHTHTGTTDAGAPVSPKVRSLASSTATTSPPDQNVMLLSTNPAVQTYAGALTDFGHTHTFTTASTGNTESRPRSMGVVYFRRIK